MTQMTPYIYSQANIFEWFMHYTYMWCPNLMANLTTDFKNACSC